jgi:hypothetical protein
MDILNETNSENQKETFFTHVFSTTEEGKAEILNILQYAFLAIIPVVILNKSIHNFIPELDHDKSNLEILAEIGLQVAMMFIGIILIHRIITYIPTYSGFKYDNLTLTNIVISFLVIVLSIQTKLGLKVNVMVERFNELMNGKENMEDKKEGAKNIRKSAHKPSQADHLDNTQQQSGSFPPAPAVTRDGSGGYDNMMNSHQANQQQAMSFQEQFEPMAANGLVGGAFGASF